tara:strand:+ start:3688 stop:4899 length:1212 start_codon:yes stop_codon:yes gene_type:complete
MIKVLYINYENLYKTSILQAMVVKPLDIISKNHNVKFVVTSACKDFERDEIYFKNKNFVETQTELDVMEFKKKLKPNQSILTFIKDIFPIIKFVIKESKKFDIIHCRSYGGAVIGFVASIISGVPFIFDMRGLLPEETVDVGKIKKNSLKFKLMKLAEKILIKNSAHIIVVSEKFKDLIKKNYKASKVTNINNPTDFDMFSSSKTCKNKITFLYSGSLQEWHMPEVVIKYYSNLFDHFGNKVHLNFCTNNPIEAKEIFKSSNLPRNSFDIKNIPFNEIGREYIKADIGFCLIKNTFSKSVCAPVKFSEYIASNIYVIGNEGIGDIPEIIRKFKCGVVLNDVYQVEKNSKKLVNFVENLLKNNIETYNRDDLSFLDWNNEGSINLVNIYNKILEKYDKRINSTI